MIYVFYKKLITPFLNTKIIIKQTKQVLRLIFLYKYKTLIQLWPGIFKHFFPDMQKKVKKNNYIVLHLWQYFFRLIKQFYLKFFNLLGLKSIFFNQQRTFHIQFFLSLFDSGSPLTTTNAL